MLLTLEIVSMEIPVGVGSMCDLVLIKLLVHPIVPSLILTLLVKKSGQM